MVYGISPSTDPRFNLAMEQYLFEEEPRKGPWFLLWQNDNAIIVGRNQNTETELDGDYTRARGIRVMLDGVFNHQGWYGALPEAGRFTMTWEI